MVGEEELAKSFIWAQRWAYMSFSSDFNHMEKVLGFLVGDSLSAECIQEGSKLVNSVPELGLDFHVL